MKKCPFCVEEIQDEAIKCKHCGEFLDGADRRLRTSEKTPWYYSTSFILIAVCCVGPLALPLIWFRPRTRPAWKIGLTIVVLLLTWLLYKVSVKSIETLNQYYELMKGF